MPLLGALTLAVFLSAKADEKKEDREVIQGSWTMVSFEVNGEAITDAQVKTGRLVVAKDAYTPTLGGRSQAFTIVLNPEKDPRTFDITARDGPRQGRSFKGIYKIDGDTLTMCRALAEDAERPTEFATGAESGQSLVVWRRAKP